MPLITLAALAITTAHLARLYLFPFRHCKRCGGTGRKHSRISRRSYSLCPHCDGTGRQLRPGSRMIHRAVLAARSPRARDRLRRRDTRTADRTQLPGRPLPPERSRP